MTEDILRVLDRPEFYGTTKPPSFGHDMLKYFSFDPEYLNLNHGSYGSLPKPVSSACRDLWDLTEAAPDRFHRLQYQSLLIAVRQRLAKLVGVNDVDEVVIVPNASHGLNTILRNFIWDEEDVIITSNTTYKSISKTAQFISDTPPHPRASRFTLLFPTTVEEILKNWRTHLEDTKASLKQGRKIVAVIDSIVSEPGVLLPWARMVEISKEYGVWTVVDAAHSIGQEFGIKLDEVKPDFWVSNCHKWLFAKRPCSVMYVPKRNQHLVVSSFPVAHAYISPKDRTDENFVAQYEWTGTIDFVPYLSVAAALHFREWVGGEVAINEYCHKLALEGGKKAADVMETELLDASQNGVFVAHMVNVALPFPPSVPATLEIKELLINKLLVGHKAFAAPYWHNGKWWARFSAQVWNEVSDFEKLGEIFKVICRDIVQELAL